MKKVLITGENSYIGTSFKNYIESNNFDYEIKTICLKDSNWKNEDFSSFDTILHVAGIAHSDNGKLTEEKKKLYYNVNTNLSYEVALKCNSDNVKQFIYLSSMIVFGDSEKIGVNKRVNNKTKTNPANAYGDSKLQAEIKLRTNEFNKMNIAIIRPPMVYGKGSKGNYPTLSKIARKIPIFPKVENERSMIYIENLCEFIRLIIKNEEYGTFMPQNQEYVTTYKLVKEIRSVHSKKTCLTKVFNLMLKLLSSIINIINKVFGNLSYDYCLSDYKENYNVVSFEESIKRTEL